MIPVVVVLPRTIFSIMIPMGLMHHTVVFCTALAGRVVAVPQSVHCVLAAAVP